MTGSVGGKLAKSYVTLVQLADLKQKLAWKGVGKQAIKAIVKPGEPDLDAKQPNIPMHGGVC